MNIQDLAAGLIIVVLLPVVGIMALFLLYGVLRAWKEIMILIICAAVLAAWVHVT